MKKLSGGIRIALAQSRALAAFAQFASDLDDATRKQLERGQRVTELMKQKQYAPMSVAEQALSIYAVDKGYMDAVPVNKIGAFAVSYTHLDVYKRQGLFDELRFEAERTVKAKVISAAALPAAELYTIKQALKRRFGREVEVDTAVDASLLGGAAIDAGDIVIAGSPKGKLCGLQAALQH